MTWIDIILLLPIAIGLIRGLMRGFWVEVTALLSLVLGVVVSRIFGHNFAEWFHTQFQWPDVACNIVAYTLLFVGVSILLTIIGRLLTRLFKAIHLGAVNRLMGGVLGTLKWGVLLIVLLLLFRSLDNQFHIIPTDSKSRSLIYEKTIPYSDQLIQQVCTPQPSQP